MNRLVIASHGQFASGIVDSLHMIAGDSANYIEVYCMKPGEAADDYAKTLEKEILAHNDDTFVVLTDLYGASVCNALMRLSSYENVFVVSGVNLNLALAILLEQETINASSLQELVNQARDGIKIVEMQTLENEDF